MLDLTVESVQSITINYEYYKSSDYLYRVVFTGSPTMNLSIFQIKDPDKEKKVSIDKIKIQINIDNDKETQIHFDSEDFYTTCRTLAKDLYASKTLQHAPHRKAHSDNRTIMCFNEDFKPIMQLVFTNIFKPVINRQYTPDNAAAEQEIITFIKKNLTINTDGPEFEKQSTEEAASSSCSFFN